MNIIDLQNLYSKNEKITMLTCYDYAFAKILSKSEIDCLLVGDSVAMVLHGYDSTIHADIEMMSMHTAAVSKGAKNKFIIADMPFLSYRQGLEPTMQAVQKLMCSGANAIKLEGADGNIDIIQHIVDSGVPVMGHLGLTPQSVHKFGGHKVQARDVVAADLLLRQAEDLQRAGCFSLALECIPAKLANKVTQVLDIPTIGIGAGAGTSGQVLVLPDMLGFDPDFMPKLLKHYNDFFNQTVSAVNAYNAEVKGLLFPGSIHEYK